MHDLVFLANNFEWAASTIAELYKARWQVELLFKELKQTLQLLPVLLRWRVALVRSRSWTRTFPPRFSCISSETFCRPFTWLTPFPIFASCSAYLYRRWQKWKGGKNVFASICFLGVWQNLLKWGKLLNPTVFPNYSLAKIGKIGRRNPVFARFCRFHSLLSHRNYQLLSERIASYDLEAVFVPVSFEKFKYRPSQILGEHLFGQCPHLGHGRGGV